MLKKESIIVLIHRLDYVALIRLAPFSYPCKGLHNQISSFCMQMSRNQMA